MLKVDPYPQPMDIEENNAESNTESNADSSRDNSPDNSPKYPQPLIIEENDPESNSNTASSSSTLNVDPYPQPLGIDEIIPDSSDPESDPERSVLNIDPTPQPLIIDEIIPHSTRKRGSKHIFLCVTGQLQRLILARKMQTLMDPLSKDGYTIHVALLLTDDKNQTFFTNNETITTTSELPSFAKAVEKLESRGYHVLTRNATTQNPDPAVSFLYMGLLDKKNLGKAFQMVRTKNHARQFETLNECYDVMKRAEKEYHMTYQLVMRIRDDAAFLEPWDLSQIMPVTKKTIMSSDCRCWAGMNDRFAVVSRDAAKPYFSLPFRRYEAISKPGNCTKSTPEYCLQGVLNPETFLMQTYENHGLSVNRTRRLRHILKYVINNTKTELPEKEIRIKCPGAKGGYEYAFAESTKYPGKLKIVSVRVPPEPTKAPRRRPRTVIKNQRTTDTKAAREVVGVYRGRRQEGMNENKKSEKNKDKNVEVDRTRRDVFEEAMLRHKRKFEEAKLKKPGRQ
ncbi:expressed unknown protein [Seminavis robusta]|uniref:Uncharacterized protein n=1 Tax=Seminavis robusta TaxID=568900 RepID=A0A9N8DKP6_9STRA|nr:expressed unknown protein [Seminavis robusta]|eukprot:Sro175_g076990.1 n/a (509) ;mRNA; r:36681-38207